MIDLLVCAPSREALIQLGIATGFLPADVGTDVPEFVPTSGLNIAEIGIHYYQDGEEGQEAPGWWVMLRAGEGTPIPPEVEPFIVERDPKNPAVPNRVWF